MNESLNRANFTYLYVFYSTLQPGPDTWHAQARAKRYPDVEYGVAGRE